MIRLKNLKRRLKLLLVPKDPNDDKNVIMEIRGAAGGDEAALFAGNLFRMYSRYAEMNNWKVEVMDSSPTELGGFKEIIFMINGNGAYSKLKYENGAHRVQRVPETESGGRIHTSTATVACFRKRKKSKSIFMKKISEPIHSHQSGPGGQSVNTTMSAVRLRTCRQESQYRAKMKNRKLKTKKKR